MQAPDIVPIQTNTVYTVCFDFGNLLKYTNLFIVSVNSVVCKVSLTSTVLDSDPISRIIGFPQIISSSSTGKPATEVAQQFGNCINSNVRYLLIISVNLSNSDIRAISSHLLCL